MVHYRLVLSPKQKFVRVDVAWDYPVPRSRVRFVRVDVAWDYPGVTVTGECHTLVTGECYR